MSEFNMNIPTPVQNSTENKRDKGVVQLTKGQDEALRGIVDFINKPYDEKRFVYGLTGAAGTGKTFIINAILRKCRMSKTHIKCTSPTHKACRVFSEAVGLKVDTIQSTFGFRLNLNLENFDYNNPAFRPISAPKLDDIQLLICDEASMLNQNLVNYMIKKCSELSIKLLYIGDASQLAPVNESKSTAFLRCNKVFNLTEIVRQGEGNPILILLDLLRYDIDNVKYSSRRFLDYINKNRSKSVFNSNGEGFHICSPKEFTNDIRVRFNDEEYTRNIEMFKIVAYTNDCVAQWNSFVRTNIIADNERGIITKNDLIMSYQTIVDEFNGIIINNSEEYIIKEISNFTDAKYGFKGFMIKFQMVNGGGTTRPLFIIDHTDKFTILKYINTLDELVTEAKKASGGTRASKWKAYYDFKKTYLISTNIKRGDDILYQRDLDYAFTITAHRAQGSTYDNVFVDLNNMIYTSRGSLYANYEDMLRRIYVACSRARKELVISFGK